MIPPPPKKGMQTSDAGESKVRHNKKGRDDYGFAALRLCVKKTVLTG
jgi:hypothetical protein